jgi:hypothetical protein
VILLIAAAAAGLLVAVPRLWSSTSGAAVAVPYRTASLPAGISVTSSERAAPTDPFAGTPAAKYATGAAGLTLPKPSAVKGFSRIQVDKDLKQGKRAMIAGRLDPRMLTGHQASLLLTMLAPNVRTTIQQWFKTAGFSGVATWIDPAARLENTGRPQAHRHRGPERDPRTRPHPRHRRRLPPEALKSGNVDR